MATLLLMLQLFVAVLLVGLILLHSAKGEGLAGIGGEAHLFGSARGLEEGLDRITAGTAALFILLAIAIFLMYT